MWIVRPQPVYEPLVFVRLLRGEAYLGGQAEAGAVAHAHACCQCPLLKGRGVTNFGEEVVGVRIVYP